MFFFTSILSFGCIYCFGYYIYIVELYKSWQDLFWFYAFIVAPSLFRYMLHNVYISLHLENKHGRFLTTTTTTKRLILGRPKLETCQRGLSGTPPIQKNNTPPPLFHYVSYIIQYVELDGTKNKNHKKNWFMVWAGGGGGAGERTDEVSYGDLTPPTPQSEGCGYFGVPG